jgi:hypothetical protein
MPGSTPRPVSIERRFPALFVTVSLAAGVFAAPLLAACQGPPTFGAPGDDIGGDDDSPGCTTEPCADAGAPDAPVTPAAPPQLMVFNDVHIASFFEAPHAFSLLGTVLNSQLEMLVKNGTLRLGLMVADLADPSGQSDPEVTAGMVALTDTDGDPANDFDPAAPEQFKASGSSVGADGKPASRFSEAAISGGMLEASGLPSLTLPGGLPLMLKELSLTGKLVAGSGSGGGFVKTMSDGRLSGALGLSLLGALPNLIGQQCMGATLLDAVATGCGLFAVQPDVDLDGDGLETLFDNQGANGMPGKDGKIDTCIDGDKTKITGTNCPSDPRIKDGYQLILVVTGVRAELVK